MKKSFKRICLFLVLCIFVGGFTTAFAEGDKTKKKTSVESSMSMMRSAERIDFDNAKSIYGGTNEVSIGKGETKVFKLYAYISAEVNIFSKGSHDTIATLYDQYGNVIQSNDNSGEELNFKMTEMLEDGRDYYIAVRFYSNDVSGSFLIGIFDNKSITANPKSGTYNGPIKVTLAPRTSGQVIYYSTDGRYPVYYGSVYKEPISVTTSSVIKAMIFSYYGQSEFEFRYKIEPKMNSIDLPENVSLKMGESKKLNPIIYPKKAENNELTWTSSNTNVVRVDNYGNIQALRDGISYVTARNSDGTCAATTKVMAYSDWRMRLSLPIITQKYHKGDKIIVPVSVSDVNAQSGIDGFQFDLNFDSSKLDLASIHDGNSNIGGDLRYNRTTPGSMRFLFVNSKVDQPVSKDGELLRLEFILKDNVENSVAKLNFNTDKRMLFLDKNLSEIPLAIQSGYVNLLGQVYGDVNGDGGVDVSDLYHVKQYILGHTEHVPNDKRKYADVNGDGYIDLMDAMLIQRYILGIIDSFPVAR